MRTVSIFSDTFFQRARRGVSASNPLIHITHHVTSWRSSGGGGWVRCAIRGSKRGAFRFSHIGRARSRVNKRQRARRAGERRDDWRADAHSSTRTAGGRASGRRNERCHLSFRSAELRGTADPGRPEPGSGRARRRAGSRAYEHAARGSCTAGHPSLGRASGGTRDESLVPLPRAGSCCCCCAGCGCGYLRP